MANNFSGDDSCKALWRFESGALTVDSKGSNTLTAVNGPTGNTSDYREGACASQHSRSSKQYYKITDAALPSDFPFKSGGTARKGTYCGWFKFASTTGNQGLIGKLQCSGSCGVYQYNGTFYLDWNSGYQSTGIAATSGVWYHVACRMDLDNLFSNVRIYRASDGQVFTYAKTTWGSFNPGAYDFRIGTFNDDTNAFDGLADEVVIFNRLLSDIEIDGIRSGTFPPPGAMFVDAGGLQAVYGLGGFLQTDAAGLKVVYSLNEEVVAVVKVDAGGIAVAYHAELPPRRIFPVPNPKVRWQSHPRLRTFPVVN
jgi:hypothetical protein